MERQTVKTVRDLVRQALDTAARPGPEVTVRTYTGDLVTGLVTYAGQIKFRLDTPQAAIFFTYDEVEEVV
jgi:hypothetical protein